MGAPPAELRRKECAWAPCGAVFYVCRSCDRGYLYCSEQCRREARLLQHRRANRVYQQSRAARLDHAARQSEYRRRLKQNKVTDQGSASHNRSASIAWHAEGIDFKSERVKARSAPAGKRPLYPSVEAPGGPWRCFICGRLPATGTCIGDSS